MSPLLKICFEIMTISCRIQKCISTFQDRTSDNSSCDTFDPKTPTPEPSSDSVGVSEVPTPVLDAGCGKTQICVVGLVKFIVLFWEKKFYALVTGKIKMKLMY